MGIPVTPQKLIDENVVEHARIEYKQNWNPERVLYTLCAYANDIDNWGGGYILIGVSEKDGLPVKPVQGIDVRLIDSIQKELLKLCHKIQPSYMPICEPVVYEGKQLLLIWAPGGYERPYKAKVSLSAGCKETAYYVRRFSSTVKASDADVKELHYLGSNVPFDDRVNPSASVSDLKLNRMLDYLSTVESSLIKNNQDLTALDLALSLRVASGPKEYLKPLNVGLMFFADNPESYFREARIDVVSVPNPTGEGMIERCFTGPLDKQLTDALSYIKNFVIAEEVSKKSQEAQSSRVFNYPFAAIEEALSNAVYHRSYQVAEPVTVRIETDKLIIDSFPGPDRTISDKDLNEKKLRPKRYRNRRIGDFLKELRLVEGRGTGVPTMLKALKDNGSQPPIFETDEERSYFSVTFMIHERFVQRTEYDEHTNEPKRRSREQLKGAVLQLLDEKAYSQKELASKLGYAGVSKSMRFTIAELIGEGIVEYTTASEKDPNAKLRKVH